MTGRAAAGERREQDPEARLEHARALAWSALNRRERTEAEIRGLLADKRVGPAEIETVVGELLEGRYVDDERYAHRFAEDRRALDGWGAERIERKLRSLGIAPDVVREALGDRVDEDELTAAVALLARRVPAVPQTPRERDRALGILVRKGYALEVAHDALRRYADGSSPDDPDSAWDGSP